jgi:hypothetical protein
VIGRRPLKPLLPLNHAESAHPLNPLNPLNLPHLDISFQVHQDVTMRTTVTLDPDVDRLLKEEMRRSGTTFRQALNQAIRRALAGNVVTERRPFKLRPKRLSLRPGLDPALLQHLEEELEIESFIQKTRKLSRS